MRNTSSQFALLSMCLFLAACAAGPIVPSGSACSTGRFTVFDDFSGARRGNCKVINRKRVVVENLREDDAVTNLSPWYAFRIEADAAGFATVTIDYGEYQHRYVPKISTDQSTWTPLSAENVTLKRDSQLAHIKVPVIDGTVWLSAQELITPDIYSAWNEKMAVHAEVALTTLGQSRAGNDIEALSSNSASRDILFLLGRQHPPEVSGSFAFFSFYEALLADTELAREFRGRFGIVAVPLLNPDGVVGGHWRHNLGETDLNRDWGFFEQPETQLMRDLLAGFETDGRRLRVFLDFHSTANNLFYTQNEDNASQPPNFTKRWLDNTRNRGIDYPFTNEEGTPEQEGVAKNYIYHRYGIPTATYEVGDESDRQATREAAAVFAEELMHLMLGEIK